MIGLHTGIAGSYTVLAMGEKAVGNATVQLQSTSLPCAFIWVGAPTANHTKAGANTGRILVGKSAVTATQQNGGMPLELTDLDGFLYLVEDANKVYFTGFNANDVVEYQVFGKAKFTP